MSDPFVERLFAGIPEEILELRPHIAEIEAFNRQTRPGSAGKAMLICPVNGCPWRYRRVEPELEQVVSLATIGDGIRAAIDAAQRVEDDVARAHLAEHPVEDFLRTIAELRTELAGK